MTAPNDTPEPSAELRHRDPIQQRGFTVVENALLTDTRLSPTARLLYALLKMHAWQSGAAWPGQERLATLLGIKPRQLRGYIAELRVAGLITIEQRGLTQTNRYIIEAPLPPDRQYIAGQSGNPLPAPAPDRQYIAGQDRQSIAGQDRQSIADKEDSVEEDSDRKERETAPSLSTALHFEPDAAFRHWWATECAAAGVAPAQIRLSREIDAWHDWHAAHGTTPADPTADARQWMRRALSYWQRMNGRSTPDGNDQSGPRPSTGAALPPTWSADLAAALSAVPGPRGPAGGRAHPPAL